MLFSPFHFYIEKFLQYIVLHFSMCICNITHIFSDFNKTTDLYYKNNWYTKNVDVYNVIKFVKTLLL